MGGEAPVLCTLNLNWLLNKENPFSASLMLCLCVLTPQHLTVMEDVGRRVHGHTSLTPLGHAVQHLLQASMEQSCLNQELAQGLRVKTQELTALCGLPTDSHPFPDPAHNMQPILMKMSPENDMEEYLRTFEQTVLREAWPCPEWPHLLAPLLTGEAQ